MPELDLGQQDSVIFVEAQEKSFQWTGPFDSSAVTALKQLLHSMGGQCDFLPQIPENIRIINYLTK